MAGPEFFQTRMGTRFFEVTMPRLVEEIAKMNENLTALVGLMHEQAAAAAAVGPKVQALDDKKRPCAVCEKAFSPASPKSRGVECCSARCAAINRHRKRRESAGGGA